MSQDDLTPITNTLAEAAQNLFVLGHLPDCWFDDNLKKHWNLKEEPKPPPKSGISIFSH